MVDIEVLDEPLVEDPEQIALSPPSTGPSSAPSLSTGVAALAERLLAVDDPGDLADLAVYSPDLSLPQKVEFLEALDTVERRLTLLLDWMGAVLGDLSLREKVREDATERLEKGASGRTCCVSRWRPSARNSARRTATSPPSTGPSWRARTSPTRWPRRSPARSTGWSGWASRPRAHLDTHLARHMFDLPWGTTSEDHPRPWMRPEVLDADHTGLEDVKERILEHLAVRKLPPRAWLIKEGDDRNTGPSSSSSVPPGSARPPG